MLLQAQTLQAFLALNEEQKQFLREFHHKYPNQSDTYTQLATSELINQVVNVSDMVKLVKVDSLVAYFAAQPAMASYWEDEWKNIGSHPTYQEAEKDPSLTYRPLKPQANMRCFDLVRGMVFYRLSLRHAEFLKQSNITPEKVYSHSEVIEYLCEAYKYNSFSALQALNSIDLNVLRTIKEPIDINIWETQIKEYKRFAKIHGTPVYMILAMTCWEIGNYYLRLDENKGNIKENYYKVQAFYSYKNMLIYLQTAMKLTESCTDSIHNAYNGLGLEESNPWKRADLNSLYNDIVTKILCIKDQVLLKRIETWADREVEYYQHEIDTTDNQLSPKGFSI